MNFRELVAQTGGVILPPRLVKPLVSRPSKAAASVKPSAPKISRPIGSSTPRPEPAPQATAQSLAPTRAEMHFAASTISRVGRSAPGVVTPTEAEIVTAQKVLQLSEATKTLAASERKTASAALAAKILAAGDGRCVRK
jgi:hypothetical protein